MSVVNTDIKIRYSVLTGSAGNSTAGTRAGSLGKYMSTTDVGAAPNAFFDNVSSAEALSGDTEYACAFVYNAHSTDSALNVVIQLGSEITGGATHSLALDNIATSAANSASAQAAQVADENSAPSGVGTFDTSSKSIGTLAAGQCKAFWVKRVVGAATGPLNPDGFTITVGGDG